MVKWKDLPEYEKFIAIEASLLAAFIVVSIAIFALSKILDWP